MVGSNNVVSVYGERNSVVEFYFDYNVLADFGGSHLGRLFSGADVAFIDTLVAAKNRFNVETTSLSALYGVVAAPWKVSLIVSMLRNYSGSSNKGDNLMTNRRSAEDLYVYSDFCSSLAGCGGVSMEVFNKLSPYDVFRVRRNTVGGIVSEKCDRDIWVADELLEECLVVPCVEEWLQCGRGGRYDRWFLDTDYSFRGIVVGNVFDKVETKGKWYSPDAYVELRVRDALNIKMEGECLAGVRVKNVSVSVDMDGGSRCIFELTPKNDFAASRSKLRDAMLGRVER